MNIPYVFKKCSKCGRWLVASTINFNKTKRGKYGLRADCKECVKIYNKKRYEENTEKIIAHSKKYNEEHKEERSEYYKNWYGKHIEEKKKYDKKYYEEHIEKFVEHSKNYYEENKDEFAKRSKIYREENKEKIAKQTRKYRTTPQGQANILNAANKRRLRKEQQGEGITGQQWLQMMKFFCFKCAYSGITLNTDTRSIDHIVPLTKGGAHEIWNCVPMYKPYNSSKYNKDLEEWYLQQDFYDEGKLNKINEWRKYAYNKWGNKVNTKTI